MTQNTEVGLVPEFTVADRLRKAREIAGFEQIEFAELLGVSRGTVSNYERGTTTRVRPIVMRAWAMATGVSIDWLETGQAPTSGTPGPDGGEGGALLPRLDSNQQPSD